MFEDKKNAIDTINVRLPEIDKNLFILRTTIEENTCILSNLYDLLVRLSEEDEKDG